MTHSRPGPRAAILLSCLAILFGLLVTLPPPGPAGAAELDAGGTEIGLASAGDDGRAGQGDSGQAVLAADGGSTVFASTAELATGASVPQTGAPAEGTSRIFARGRPDGGTTLLSDAGAGDATAPTVSADGRRVAYEEYESGSGENQIVAVDRLATGGGSLDGPGNLAVSQVTDSASDVHYQRLPGCSAAGSSCGPRLSADGSTLAYPAVLSPVSPVLGGSGPGNLLDLDSPADLGAGGPVAGTSQVTIAYTNLGQHPIDFLGAPTVSPPFALGPITCAGSPVTAIGTLAPGAGCSVTVLFDAGAVCGVQRQALAYNGDLVTDATTPDGQTDQALLASCGRTLTSFTEAAGTPLADCPAPPAGLTIESAPTAAPDDQGNPLVDLGASEIGAPRLVAEPLTGDGTVDVTGGGCALRLVDPTGLDPANPPAAGSPAPCAQGTELGDPDETATSCTAYFLVAPQTESTSAALVTVGYTGPQAAFLLAATGVAHVVVARSGPDFATAPAAVVSVAAGGTPIPGSGAPSLSADGRYLAFTSGSGGASQVWRHDAGTGGTVLESCLPGTGCPAATDAVAPAISGDGDRIAFATADTPAAPGQVYLREVSAGRTILVSATTGPDGTTVAGNATSAQPDLSEDGSTVAFVSSAADLTGRTGESDLLLRDFAAGDPGPTLAEPVDTAEPGPAATGQPSLDAHGRIAAFPSDVPLLDGVPAGSEQVYTVERLGSLTLVPSAIDFGAPVAGTAGQYRTITVTDAGPGPVTITGITVTGPFRLATDTCADLVAHQGQSCTVTAWFAPLAAGDATGRLSVRTQDDNEAAVVSAATLTARVLPAPVPPVPPATPAAPMASAAVLTLSPPVASGGQVVRVTGSAFPPGTTLTLSWNRGLGTTPVTTGPDGRFGVSLPIFPDDLLGPRRLSATGPDGAVLGTAGLLVEADPQEPPFHRAGGS